MYRHLRSTIASLALIVIGITGSGALAQGVTGAAITGIVTDGEGKPISGASVQLRNPATGHVFTVVTGSSGEYFIDNVPAGGPYILTTNASGFASSLDENIQLNLGARLKQDVVLRPFQEEIVVVAHYDQNADKRRTGPSTTVKAREIAKLPLQSRNFTDLTSTSPVVSRESGGVSIAGQNIRSNNIQVDGAANNDLFGLSANGLPGGLASGKPLSIEAIQEFVVQVSPFDVRQGNFTGGLINAITKSGTNDYHGSLFGYFQNKSLAGFRSDPTFTDYNTWQYGATVSGPIVKDKLHFFVAADLQTKRGANQSDFQIGGQDAVADRARAGFDNGQAERFANILTNQYGTPAPGTALGATLRNPDYNVFIKASTSFIENSNLELSYNFVDAARDILTRSPLAVRFNAGGLRDGYQLSNSGYANATTTNSGRAKLTTNWGDGKWSNEFLGGFSIIRDHRTTPTQIPLILVDVGRVGAQDAWLAAGSERFSQTNVLDQDIYQLQDNITYALDRHRITLGTSNEFFKIRNAFLQASTGIWAFNCLNIADGCENSLEQGRPSAFLRRLGGIDALQEPGTAKFNVNQLGLYLQDDWSPFRNLTITPGIRIDVPFLSKAPTNPVLLANSNFPIDTGKVPTGNILWSPRLGVNWDVNGNSETIVRGGGGIFSGRPPYVWVSNAYSINGLSQREIFCTGAGVPAFTVDPSAQPTSCLTTGPTSQNVGEVDYFDANTKYPQNLRVALGADQRLPWGIVGTADFLYTQDVNGWYTTDTNLVQSGTSSDGRPLYSVNGAFGSRPNTNVPPIPPTLITANPNRIDNTFLGPAIKVYNKNGGRVYSATLQLQKQFARRYNVSAAYTYADSRDRISFSSSQAFSNFRFTPLDGDLGNRNLRPSQFDRPHRITLTGTASLPYGFGAGLTYIGQSGLAYTYVVNGDVNGDGISDNDLVFVPADPNQITLRDSSQWDALNRFIDSQDCLRAARGGFVKRGACRNPWNNYLDARLTWTSPPLAGQRIEFQFDVFNVLNLINSKWGLFDRVAANENGGPQFLTASGYDAANNRPIYDFQPPTLIKRTIYSPTESRWRIQLGARYNF